MKFQINQTLHDCEKQSFLCDIITQTSPNMSHHPKLVGMPLVGMPLVGMPLVGMPLVLVGMPLGAGK
jgi:hypothetical protein